MTNLQSDLEALFAQFSGEVKKEAQAAPVEDDAQVKLAEDLYAAGEIMATGFVDRALEKIAGSGVPAAGGGQADPIASPRSVWESVAARLAAAHGRKSSIGDDTSVRAEDEVGKGAGHSKGKAGATGVVNTQKNLG